MTKSFNKETIKRSRLRNKFLNKTSNIDRKAYKKQRNYAVSILRNEKRIYSNLGSKAVTGNRIFWKTVKPFLSVDVINHSKLTWL